MTQQFLVIEYGEDNEMPTMHVATEKDVSNRIDMSDCEPSPCRIYALVGDKVEPVTFGEQKRTGSLEENDIRYANTPMYAGGELVGHVTHTDH